MIIDTGINYAVSVGGIVPLLLKYATDRTQRKIPTLECAQYAEAMKELSSFMLVDGLKFVLYIGNTPSILCESHLISVEPNDDRSLCATLELLS